MSSRPSGHRINQSKQTCMPLPLLVNTVPGVISKEVEKRYRKQGALSVPQISSLGEATPGRGKISGQHRSQLLSVFRIQHSHEIVCALS